MKLKTIIDKEKLLILLLLCFITVIYFKNSSIRAGDDTFLYIEYSKLSLSSLDFWANEYFPFLFPLLLKWLNRDVFLTVLVQVLISLVVWYSFILTFLGVIKHQSIRFLSIIALTGFGLSIDIFGWNWVIQTESLHNSMLVFYLNAIFLFYLHHRQQEQWKYSVLILFSSILFCSARDPGMYFVLIVSLGFLLERIFLFPNQVKRKALLVNAVAGFLVFVAFQSMFNHQNRGVLPLGGMFTVRISEQEFRNYFEERGMPPRDSTDWSEWNRLNGKKEFARYLLSRPIDSFSEIFLSPSQLKKIFDEPLGYYMGLHQEEKIVPSWYTFFERVVLFPRGTSYLFFALLAGICLVYLTQCRKVSPVLKLAVLMLIASVMLAFALGHVSGTEIQRHTLIVKLMTRLAFFLVILTATDRFLDKRVYGKHLIR